MTDAIQCRDTLISYYHSHGEAHTAARGQLLEIALHGRGKPKALARQALALTDRVVIVNKRTGA